MDLAVASWLEEEKEKEEGVSSKEGLHCVCVTAPEAPVVVIVMGCHTAGACGGG